MKGNPEEIQVFDVNTWVEKYLERQYEKHREACVFSLGGCVCVCACARTRKGVVNYFIWTC